MANGRSGGAAASAFPQVGDADLCPCGSARRFGGCCAPLLRGDAAATPESLMRSRYTAFVVGDGRHLTATWHPGTRPDDVDPDPAMRWTGLEVVGVAGGGEGDKRGVVEFRAGWRSGVESGVLHERSRFVRQSGRWWYLDGTLDPAAF